MLVQNKRHINQILTFDNQVVQTALFNKKLVDCFSACGYCCNHFEGFFQ
jgi:hypothetical protein